MQTKKRTNEKANSSRRGFTLVEMLVVIGIISILLGVAVTSFSKMAKTADRTKAQELVSQTATALAAIYEADGMWPKLIREGSTSDSEGKGRLDHKVAMVLAQRGYMSLTTKRDKNGNVQKLQGRDRFGILTPWASKIVERKSDASLGDKVSGGTTVEENILRFVVDLNGDGEITQDEGCGRVGEARQKVGSKKSESVEVIRAAVAVWCVDKEGKDLVESWTKGQEQKVQ